MNKYIYICVCIYIYICYVCARVCTSYLDVKVYSRMKVPSLAEQRGWGWPALDPKL